MKHDLKDFFDISQHYAKLQRDAQKIRNKQPMAQTSLYLHDLFDHFIKDIGDIAEQIYDEALLKHSKKEIKIIPSELKILVIRGTESSLESYNRIIQGYNMGGMLREYDNVQKDIDLFKLRAKQTCTKQSDICSANFKNHLKKQRNENWTFYASMLAAATGLIGIPIAIWYGQNSTYKTTDKQLLTSEQSNSNLAYSYTGYLAECLSVKKSGA